MLGNTKSKLKKISIKTPSGDWRDRMTVYTHAASKIVNGTFVFTTFQHKKKLNIQISRRGKCILQINKHTQYFHHSTG